MRDSEISKVLNGWYELGKAPDQESDENASCNASPYAYGMMDLAWFKEYSELLQQSFDKSEYNKK